MPNTSPPPARMSVNGVEVKGVQFKNELDDDQMWIRMTVTPLEDGPPQWQTGPLPTEEYTVILPKYLLAPSYNQQPLMLVRGEWCLQESRERVAIDWVDGIVRFMILQPGPKL